jgi:hypothetical protein
MIVPIASRTSDKEKLSLLAKAFFMAATKLSKDEDDILPQVDSQKTMGNCKSRCIAVNAVTPFT